MTEGVRVERDGAVAWVVLDNEARRNALTAGMLAQGLDAFAMLAGDDTVRVVVLRGAGDRAFVSGADIATLTGAGEDPRILELARAITGLDKPVIAALRGWCLGAGVLLAAAADVRVAGDDVKFGIPAAKLGVAYPSEGVARLVQLVGPAVAAELLMSAETIDAAAARELGLLNRVVATDEVFAVALGLARTMAANAPLSLRAAKRAINAAEDAEPAIRACFASDDFAEGRRAFAEKRAPVFRGR
jgi:enoyl-CoA hydratase/carnithine racemase